MARPIVIIHGWSDSSSTFRPLKRKLARALGRPVELIGLADYESRDDEITFDDVVTAMDEAWTRKGLPRHRGSVDVVVHSTGGLVIRDWLARNYRATARTTDAPIKRLVMLAPANFGSPLAHKGRSFFGRVVKGWDSKKMFQTGKEILKGLELASPYSWELALRDRFGSSNFYDKGKVLATVLVGNTGYSGIAAAANEAGSDGTVRVSTANMNCVYIKADFSDPHHPTLALKKSKGKTAFGVLDQENHSTITAKRRPKNDNTLAYIVRGLTVTDGQFSDWCRQLDRQTDRVMADTADESYTHGYQNTVFLVRDQFDAHVQDYFLEFYVEDEDASWFEEMFHREAIRTVHAYGDDKAYRAVLIDCSTLKKRIDKPFEKMKISLTAMPQFSANKNVGYKTFTDDEIGAVEIAKSRIGQVFQSNRTALVEVILKREQADDVFTIR